MLFAYFFLYLEKIFTRVETWALPALLKATLWGIVLSVLTLVTDYALFSGEFHIVPFSKTALREIKFPAGDNNSTIIS